MSDSANTLIIGVDGGGTGCRVAIGTLDGKVVARAEGGRANIASDPELAIGNIIKTVEAAAIDGAIAVDRLSTATAHLGLAGVMTTQDAQMVASALPYRDTFVTDDRSTALNGAFGGQDGVLLSVGTGTIAAGRKDGVYRSLGGWGFYVGDQASGSWLGKKCLRQVLLCHDGIAQHSELTRALFAKFGDDPNEIVAFSMSAKPGDYGAFAPEVVSWAKAGDPIGKKIVQKGATHLLRCLKVLQFNAGDPLCLTGGVGPHYASYLPDDVTAGLVKPLGNALDGAFAFAKARAETCQEGVS
ncbi:BadF/BadG/BcrA/BcrD ATPase family protein [Cognatishimia sp. MH4019]|uniref:BadF/BadG/BcrA/BcrD ATPase family protein n=1 Tax=Cognatishimia sp. MH4019 TaxID=2854030 RepID=UPI001CD2992A|nr:BadF/BadG/BcrA/BcrD ATPase family protein [Cognatishimia sp. MH4019]